MIGSRSLVLVVAGALSCLSASATDPPTPPETRNGGELTMRDFEGKRVLVFGPYSRLIGRASWARLDRCPRRMGWRVEDSNRNITRFCTKDIKDLFITGHQPGPGEPPYVPRIVILRRRASGY